MLPLKDAIQKLNFHRAESLGATYTAIDTQTPVVSSHLVSSVVTLPVLVESGKNGLITREKSPFVTPSHVGAQVAKWSERQDLNLRRLGPKPSALPG
jgi:hypothetical protein